MPTVPAAPAVSVGVSAAPAHLTPSAPALDHALLKHTAAIRRVPVRAMNRLVPLQRAPCVGELFVGEVIRLGKHTSYESREGVTLGLFPGDSLVGVFGHRYATDQYEGLVPTEPVAECDLLSVGGVCGQVVSQHTSMKAPTRLRVVGAVAGAGGETLRLQRFGLPSAGVHLAGGRAQIVLVVGASMNSGKTTTAGTLVRALRRAGHGVAAAKLTGTACGRDTRHLASCGADPVLDFSDAGFPSTSLLERDDLWRIYHTLLSHLLATGPAYVVLEVADGIFQRETRLLLEDAHFRAGLDHVLFAANDSLSAESGARRLRAYGLPLRAVSGMVTCSPLATRETQAVTGLPCLGIEELLAGGALDALDAAPAGRPAA